MLSSLRQRRPHRGIFRSTASLLGAGVVTAVLALSGATSGVAYAQSAVAATPAPSPTSPTAAAPAAQGAGHLVIAIDTAKAVNSDRFEASKAAAKTIVQNLPNAQIAVISFGGQGTVVYPFGSAAGAANAISILNQNTNDLDGAIAQSQMTQGLLLGVETLNSAPNPRSILMVTDGTNSGSRVNLQESRQQALNSGINIAVIDTRFQGDTEPTKKALIEEIRGVTGVVVSLDDPTRLPEITNSILSQAIPKKLGLQPETSLSTKIFSSTLTLLIGALFMGGAIFFTAFQFMGPKEVKVNLTGIPTPKVVKEVKTPMAGLATKLTELADKKLEDSGKHKGMQAWLERAAINLRSGEFMVVLLVATIAGSGLIWLTKGPVKGLLAVFIIPLLGRKFVNFKANKRTKRFGDQLSDTLQLISSSMRAGQGFMQALDAVARESESPTSEEFQRVVVEARLGRDLVDSMKALAHRIQCEDLEWVIPAVEINREVGGDLAEVLEQVGTTIRDRADLRRQVKTLSAEGRLSAVVLIALPICIGLFIKTSNPEYMQPLFHGIGLYFLGGASLMMLIGSIWLFNICKIEF
jgi:tight adherence protein B